MENFAIAIHGGAQNKPRNAISIEKEAAFRKGLEDALISGWTLLSNGQSALDAVEAAVRVLEDNPLFNASRGSVLNENGDFEFDAAIMDGETLRAGSVAAVKYIKNPVSLARAVMDNSTHVMLCGKGAEEFASRYGIETRPFDYFVNPERMEDWKRIKIQDTSGKSRDTVGAVAIDKNGNLAAASSTGGLTNKLPGRVGDTPIIGGGIYANNEVCAAACTGDGEYIIRGVYAHELYALMQYKKLSLKEAMKELFELNARTVKGEMGIIAIDRKANIEITSNSLPMYRASKKNDNPPIIAIWED